MEILRFQVRLAKDLPYLTTASDGFADKAIDKIGRRVGGWLKSGDGQGDVPAISGRQWSPSRNAPHFLNPPQGGPTADP